MAKIVPFDATTLDTSRDGPSTAFLSGSIGAFHLTGATGRGVFVWYHEDGRVDMHAHDLHYKGRGELAGADFVAYAPAHSGGEDHAHELFVFLTEAQSPHEGHRVFYVSHGHLHLWATDVRCLPVHQ